MASLNASMLVFGYGLAGTAFLILAVLLLTSFRGRLRGGLLTAAAVLSAAWAFGVILLARYFDPFPLALLTTELILDGAWAIFLSALLAGAVGAGRLWIVRHGGILLVGILLAIGIGCEVYLAYNPDAPSSSGVLVMGSILTSLYVLVVIEQIFRNARESQRRGLKYLCLGVGGIFAYDLILYSNAVFTGQISELFWGARGYAVALCVPLLAVAAQRSPSWSVGIFVSRQIVFYTATVFAAGLYLTIVGVLGYYIRSIEDSWGSAAQVIFSFAAVVGLFAFLFSERIRARSRVFINKHFYQNRYDYREEWLRLIETLTSVEEILPLKKRAIKALAMIVNAPSGILWLRSDDDLTLEAVSNWNTRLSVGQINVDDSLPTFLQRSGWVVEIGEYLADPSHYDDLELDARMLGLESPAVIVPLYTDLSLLGFVVLSEPATRLRLNYEDHDLLKTAGKQVASYLAQERATDQLAEGRQFEALNKLTAYIMHDLKNVIAQQSLVVENAQKHKDNPAFIEDAIETIRGGVKRMRRILEELQQGSATNPKQRIDLAALIMKVVSQCEDRDPAPRLTPPPDSVWVRADPERLHMAFYHAIRNAQEATPADGSVTIEFESDGERAGIRVIDTGCGMSRRFVRERLFRPFDSTKGTQGMGIGAYQIRETFRAVGGNIEIDSKESVGTTITMLLPVVAAPDYTAGKNVAAP